MHKLIFTFVAVSAAFWASAAEAIECRLLHLDGQVKMTPVKSGDGKIELVPVTLNGKPAKFRLDTAARHTGVSQDLASLLLEDFRKAVAHFGKHPVAVPMSKEESAGFNHL